MAIEVKVFSRFWYTNDLDGYCGVKVAVDMQSSSFNRDVAHKVAGLDYNRSSLLNRLREKSCVILGEIWDPIIVRCVTVKDVNE